MNTAISAGESTSVRIHRKVIGADRYKWFHPVTGKLISSEKTPTFDMTDLNTDCVVLWAESSANNSGQDKLVCLRKQGCSKACQDAE